MRTYIPPPDFQGTKFFGWFFTVMAALFLFFSLTRIIDKHASESWPSIVGTVISSKIYQQSRPAHWCFSLHYSYVVDNHAFSSKRLSTSLLSSASCSRSKDITAARVARMYPGAQIRIRYSESDPGKSMIYRDTLSGFYIFIALGIVLLVGGLMCLRKAASIARAHARESKRPVT
jgi:hypothetical protein